MNIEIIKVGSLETNCYVVSINNHLYVIDPGDELDKILDLIGNRKVDSILVTHRHFDHIGALNLLKNKYHLEENTNIYDFIVINFPGHTKDSIAFYNEDNNVMFSGDFVFKGSIGRTDLGGSFGDMCNSISNLCNYNDNLVIYPGHGDKTTLGDERKNLTRYI